jgi:hypothetical protein
MIKLVVDNGERAALDSGRGNVARPARSPGLRSPAKRKSVSHVELGALIAITMIEAMRRCGMARAEQTEHILTQIADAYDAFGSVSPVCEKAAVIIRERVLEIALGET